MSEFLKSHKYWLLFLLFIIITTLVWWFGGQFLWWYFDGETHANLRGDSYGIINTLFSGFAFVGIIVSIIMQSEELRLQRDELKATRDEFKEQSKVFKMDLFEKGFYNLLDSLEKIITNFEIKEQSLGMGLKQDIFTGRDGLEKLLDRGGTNNSDLNYQKNKKMTISDLKEFISFHSNSSSQLNMYLRTFNLIVERISENIADISEKEYYGEILKCKLGNMEFTLIKLFMEGFGDNDIRLKYYQEVFPKFK